ncbi:hypothetical protein [Massilia sp. TWP1-3-3]|uniref:hypothetical protein n=1 Tax=Massilia sp. TWP1-3-3 TaxID=2804573 RepID=UPI003CECE809
MKEKNMQATLYVTEDILSVANALKDLDYAERMQLEDDSSSGLPMSAGYHLKNANKLMLDILPSNAVVGCRITPDFPDVYRRHFSAPTNLRGVIYEHGPHVHHLYRDVVSFWSGEPINAGSTSPVFHQNKLNEYMVDLSALNDATDAGDDDAVATAFGAIDKLVSEGVVICISNVEELICALSMHYYIEIAVPVNQDMLSIDSDDFLSEKAYESGSDQQYLKVWLKVADILRSPDRNCIFIDLIQHSMISYGYFY